MQLRFHERENGCNHPLYADSNHVACSCLLSDEAGLSGQGEGGGVHITLLSYCILLTQQFVWSPARYGAALGAALRGQRGKNGLTTANVI